MVPSWRKHLEIALRATPPMEICILPTVQPDSFNPLLSPQMVFKLCVALSGEATD